MYNLLMDQHVKQQELLLTQQYNEQLMRLQQAAQSKRAGLEKQACGHPRHVALTALCAVNATWRSFLYIYKMTPARDPKQGFY